MSIRTHVPMSLAVVFAVVLAACRGREAPPAPTPDWLRDGATRQTLLTGTSPVFRGFRFTDRLAASGITFVNHVVDDATKDYKPVHYDHGTGVAAADVDGDGRPDLYFVSQLGTSELWRNTGGGHFENITRRAGLELPDVIAVGAAFADIDNDGDPDLFVTTVRHGNRLFENTGGGHFKDVTAAAGVGYVGHSSGAVFFDYDGDGRLDLFLANVGVYTTNTKGPGGYYIALKDAFHGHTHPERTERSILYHNLGGGRFADVTDATGLADSSWSGDATAIDANDDGRPDLYVLDMQGENHLWLNDGGARFHDATGDYFPRTPWGAMGAKVFDVDGDGRLDLYVTDMHSDMFGDIVPGDWQAESEKSNYHTIAPDFLPNGPDRLIFGNALFVRRDATGDPPNGAADTTRPDGRGRNGGGGFIEDSKRVGGETYWPWGPSVGDLNADGWDDVFVTGGMSFPFRYSVNALFMNDAGRHLVRSEFLLGVEPRAVLDQPWFTVDCAGADRGHPSCAVCAKPDTIATRVVGCRGDAHGRLTVLATRSSRSAVILDVDGDGDLDIVTNEFNAAPQVLVSDLAQRHPVHYLAVRLHGTRSNRDGLGAVVTVVHADGRRSVQAMDGNSGYLSRSVLPLYFGLGAADHAASVEVRWPSGARQTSGGPLTSGRTVEIVEP